MKVPKSVNILGHVYQVKRTPQKKLPENTYGLCEFPTRVIKIANELHGELAWLIFLHECRHAYHWEFGFTQIMHPQVQELDCESFASFVLSLKKQGVL
jgi:hypothetical protein